jgi:hypothetical protein
MYVARKRVFKWKEAGYESYLAYHRAVRKKYYREWYLKNREKHLAYCIEQQRNKREEVKYREWYRKNYVQKTPR